MAKKAETVFVCNECGYESPKWMGQCICGAWNTMYEQKISQAKEDDKRARSREQSIDLMKLKDVKSSKTSRIDTGIKELNRVLGGGLVKGSLVLISGEPGIGKSTLILQTASNIASRYGTVLYVSGEESEEQIKIRADRICGAKISENLYILAETNMENVETVCEKLKPQFLIIDSIQTMYTNSLDSAPGSVSQVRACGNLMMRLGKLLGIPTFIVAHVTKSGELAGPKIVEHLVDCVLNFTGERSSELRILRSVKNRFGTTSEIGAFDMEAEGLLEIENLSENFLDGMPKNVEGSIATAVYEGTRPLILEIQALTAPANVGFARRSSIGTDSARLNMILAVLERKARVSLINQDVYVNVVGGLKPEGTCTDLAVALAVYSSLKGYSSSDRILAIGEIGLTGEIRNIPNCDKIIKEAVRMGFKRIILPSANLKKLRDKIELPTHIRLDGVSSISEAISFYCDVVGE